MPITITKTEDRIKPILLWSKAKAIWVTIADRSANWTPFARKNDEDDTLKNLLAALKRLRSAYSDESRDIPGGEKGDFNADSHPRAPAGTPQGGQFAPQKGALNYVERYKAAIVEARRDVETQFNAYADAMFGGLGFKHNKKDEENGWDEKDPKYAMDAEAYSRTYANKPLHGLYEEQLTLSLTAREIVKVSHYVSDMDGTNGHDFETSTRVDKLDKVISKIEKGRLGCLQGLKSDLNEAIEDRNSDLRDAASGEKPDKKAIKKLAAEVKEFNQQTRTVESEIASISRATKTDEEEADVAGEVIQKIICPIDKDLNQLKALLGEEQFALLMSAKAEKSDSAVTYTFAAEDRFDGLHETPVGGTGISAMVGELKSAEKADSNGLIPVPPGGGTSRSWMGRDEKMPTGKEPFSWQFNQKIDALRNAITSAIELSDDFTAIEDKSNEAIDAFSEWLYVALDELEAGRNAATTTDSVSQVTTQKADEPVEQADLMGKTTGLGTKIKRFFSRSRAEKTDNDATKGDDAMEITEDRLKELMTEAAEVSARTTVETMVEKAEAEKSDETAQAQALAEKEEQDARNAKLDELHAWMNEQKVLAAEKADTDTKTEPDPLAEAQVALASAQETIKALNDTVSGLAAKMDAIQRSPGASSATVETPVPKKSKAEKSDDRYSVFDEGLH